jgi:hypothetical protein
LRLEINLHELLAREPLLVDAARRYQDVLSAEARR